MSSPVTTEASHNDPLMSKSHNYKHLTPEEVEHFLTKGWLRVPGAIKEENIDKWMQDLWTRIDYDEHDKSTWHSEYLHLPRHREVPAEEFAPEAWNKIVDIVGGEDRIDPVRERYYGDAFIINFGSEDKTTQTVEYRPQDKDGWHTDDDWYRLFLDSTGNAMTVIHCAHVKDCKQFTTVTAKRGDVLLLHGLLPHTTSANHLHYARVISNPHVSLHSPLNLNRPDGNYSLLEQVILRNLGRDAVPEFQPTRERKSWYPRNAGFKRAKAQDELKRMIAAAKSKGLDESTVDSIYLRQGTKEFEEFERRNGFDKDINAETGLVMVQHTVGEWVPAGVSST
ncbi:hypothetical protein A1O1_00782 [Capronia coronata CBS 617.96]|uniref:Uncharacterized protein n=1 Tax=Capronia coronata CBS 617.96 TaxID=1182541 RepID=W9Z127_9EURO|nr:uncharacterized protein A1O1_00782 [Capronia coronata CBS 617.96]EXJ95660.1 hypothetical protein A1O1_00782 [Capronia coronata CBS 617.96]